MKQILTLTFLFCLHFVAKSQTKNFIDQPYVEVNGNADTAITPDEIYIRIILSESDTKNKISLEETETKMVAALQSLGINTEEDLTTSDVGSNFRYYMLKNKDILKVKRYLLKVSDAVMATKVVAQLEDLDISNTSIDHVDYSKMEELKNIIKTKAVENAKARALALVKPLNQSVGTAIYISEVASNEASVRSQTNGIVIRGTASINKKQSSSELPQIYFDKLKVGIGVNVKFILK